MMTYDVTLSTLLPCWLQCGWDDGTHPTHQMSLSAERRLWGNTLQTTNCSNLLLGVSISMVLYTLYWRYLW